MTEKTEQPKTPIMEIHALVEELAANGETVDQAIAAAERRLKLLRGLKATIGAKPEPKPRTTKKTTGQREAVPA